LRGVAKLTATTLAVEVGKDRPRARAVSGGQNTRGHGGRPRRAGVLDGGLRLRDAHGAAAAQPRRPVLGYVDVSHARRSLGAVVIVGLLGVGVFLWLLHDEIDPMAPRSPGAASPARAAVSPVRSTAIPPAPPAMPELPPPPEPPELRGHDTVDPCTAGFEPPIPFGFETVATDGVTVAWQPGAAPQGPYDVALQPVAVAHLITGLLAEAATLTGTPRRERLTAIVYPSRAALRAATRAPAWSDGIYDGGAVRVGALPSAELGVDVTSLRHELIHAQLHATVGCMPSWLNEGLAMYFAGAPPIRTWLRMLRNPDGFDLATLEVPSFAAMPDDRAERAYAESLAMIVFIVERSGE